MRPSRKWYKKAQEYKKCALSFYTEGVMARHRSLGEPITECPYDFSEKAAVEMYLFESAGIGNVSIDIFNNKINGYAIGKKWYDVEKNRKPLPN